MNIFFPSLNDPSSSVHGIKRPREEAPPYSETNKKIKTATNDLFSTMPTEISTKILSHLDVISLVRFSVTARKYKSLIDSDKYLSEKILFEKIYSTINSIAKRVTYHNYNAIDFLSRLKTARSCTLIKANYSKAIEVFLKQMKKTPRFYIDSFDPLRARLRLFEALALAKHPRAEEFIPSVNDYVGFLLHEYAVTLVQSKLPKALELLHNILYSADNIRDINSIYKGLGHLALRRIGEALLSIKRPKASLLFQRVIDLAEDQSTFKEVDWLSMMAELKHPRTDEFLLRAINDAEKEGNYRFLAEQLFEINHPEAIKFAELAIRTSHSRRRLKTILKLVKVSIKSKHVKAYEFSEQAIHLFECVRFEF